VIDTSITQSVRESAPDGAQHEQAVNARKITERRAQSAGVVYTLVDERCVPNVDSAELR